MPSIKTFRSQKRSRTQRRGIATLRAAAAASVAGLCAGATLFAAGTATAATPALRVGTTIVLPTSVSTPASFGPDRALFAEAPDGSVFIAHGADVYVVHGHAAPVLAERVAGPVLALAASSTDLYVETGLTVTEYATPGSVALRHWKLTGPGQGLGAPTSAGLIPEGATLWAWTDSATDSSGFEFAVVDRIATASATVHLVSRSAYPADMDADAAGLYFEGAANARLVHVTPSGAITRSPKGIPIDAPLALHSGMVLLVDVVKGSPPPYYAQSYNAITLKPVASTIMAALVESVASTTSGILAVTIPCRSQTCATAKVLQLSATTGRPSASVTLPGAQFVLRGSSPVAVVDRGHHVELVRLQS